MRVMVWMDIFGSITLNQGSKLLTTYRYLLKHDPASANDKVRLRMENVMGCDDTTVASALTAAVPG
jgi:hypothetical protein